MEAAELFDDTLHSDTPQAWARMFVMRDGKRINESEQAYAAFKQYALMGDTRSIRQVALACAKHRTLLSRWSARWRWQERCSKWDSFLFQRETEQHIKGRVQMAKRHAALATVSQNIVALQLRRLQERIQEQERVAAGNEQDHPGQQMVSLKLADLVRLMDVSCRMERAVRGEPKDDEVAQIVVRVEMRQKPRFEDEDERAKENPDPGKYRPN
jgi:hypothetical protein